MALSTNIILTVSDYDIKLSRGLKFYKNDALKLIFTINYWGIDNANGVHQRVLMPLEALSAILFMETPEGTDSIEAGAVEGNVVTFYLDSEYTQNVGVSKMQIRLFDNDGCAITLPEFPFEIRENIHGGDVRFQDVVMVDQTGTAILTEDNDLLDVGDVLTTGAVAYPQVAKTIKELPVKNNLDGTEKLIVEDDEATKQAPLRTIVDEIKQNSQEKIREIESELSRLENQVNPFTATLSISKSIAELGSSQDLTLNWSYNRDIKSQKINNDNLDISIRSKSYSNVSSSTTYTLTATSTLDLTTSKSVSITFANGIYYGVSSSVDYNSDLIKSLTKELSTNKSRTVTINASSDEYIYYCVPTRLGECSFNVNGFEGGFDIVATVSFANDFNYTENYFIYKSTNSNLGNTTVVVK